MESKISEIKNPEETINSSVRLNSPKNNSLKKKKPNHISINLYDEEIFSYLYNNKIATIAQIHRDLFHQLHATSVLRRLQRLERNYYLRKKIVGITKGMFGYSLSPKALNQFIDPTDSLSRKQLLSNHSNHDVGLVDIQARIKKSPLVISYITENQIRSGIDLTQSQGFVDLNEMYSDAGIEVQVKNENYLVSLEYEVSFKSNKQYFDKIYNYYFRDKITAVIYVCESERLLEFIKKIEFKVAPESSGKIYYCLKSKLLDFSIPMSFLNRKNQGLIIC